MSVHTPHARAQQRDPRTGGAVGGGGGGERGSGQAPSGQSAAAAAQGAQTKYLCALYGLVKYDTSLVAGGASGSGTPAPAAAWSAGGVAASAAAPTAAMASVARLCSLLRAMCHSDTQLLLQGRQSQALLELPVGAATAAASAAQQHGGPRPVTPAVATPMHPPPSPSLQQLQPPQSQPTNVAQPLPTGASAFFDAGAVPVPAAFHRLTATAPATGPSASPSPAAVAATTAGLSFVPMPLFHTASQSLLDNTQSPSSSSYAASGAGVASAVGAATGAVVAVPPAAPVPSSLAADHAYLLAREARLAPIAALVAGESNWGALVPPRFSRYTRVYKAQVAPNAPPNAPPNAVAAALVGSDVWAWREVETQSAAPVPSFVATSMSSAAATATAATTMLDQSATRAAHARSASVVPISSSFVAPGAPSAHYVSPWTPLTALPHERWFLSSLGKALLPAKTLCHVRPVRIVPLSARYESLLLSNSPTSSGQASSAGGASMSASAGTTALGPLVRDSEFVQEGFRFEDRDGVELLLYRVLRLNVSGDITSAAEVRGQHRWMLELRALCIHDSEQALQNQQHKLVQYARQLEQSGHTQARIACATEPVACGSLLASCPLLQPGALHQDSAPELKVQKSSPAPRAAEGSNLLPQ
jgi:hypothetical protein